MNITLQRLKNAVKDIKSEWYEGNDSHSTAKYRGACESLDIIVVFDKAASVITKPEESSTIAPSMNIAILRSLPSKERFARRHPAVRSDPINIFGPVKNGSLLVNIEGFAP